jgi:hypothetical protein
MSESVRADTLAVGDVIEIAARDGKGTERAAILSVDTPAPSEVKLFVTLVARSGMKLVSLTADATVVCTKRMAAKARAKPTKQPAKKAAKTPAKKAAKKAAKKPANKAAKKSAKRR